MRKPDFFIVGAPKCATTALHTYLGKHPDIFMPKQKELHHFATDLLRPDDPWRSAERYMAMFKDVKTEKLVGESSVFYLYSKLAAQNIFDFNPEARIIVMLRNPVDMLYSYHSQLVFNGDENIMNFKSALDAEESRKKGLLLPSKHLRFVERLFYGEIVGFSKQLERYFKTFSRERVYVIIYDDFRSDTANIYSKTLEFLGVDKSFLPAFQVINANKRIRSKGLQDFINSPTFLGEMVVNLLPRILRKRAKSKLEHFNVQYVSRPRMKPDIREELQEKYSWEVECLSNLLNRDLRKWISA